MPTAPNFRRVCFQRAFPAARVALQAAEARYQASIEDSINPRPQLLERGIVGAARQQLADTEIRRSVRAHTRRHRPFGEFSRSIAW